MNEEHFFIKWKSKEREREREREREILIDRQIDKYQGKNVDKRIERKECSSTIPDAMSR